MAEFVDAPDLKSSLDLKNRWTGLAETLVPFFIVLVYESAQKYLLNMLTDKQIEDQQEFERKQISGGLHKLRSNTTKLEEKTYASATVYGSACVNSIMPDLIAFIDSKKEKYKNIGAKDNMLLHKHVLQVDSAIQASLTYKVFFFDRGLFTELQKG